MLLLFIFSIVTLLVVRTSTQYYFNIKVDLLLSVYNSLVIHNIFVNTMNVMLHL